VEERHCYDRFWRATLLTFSRWSIRLSESFVCEFSQSLICCRSGEGRIDIEQLRKTIEALYVMRRSLVFRYLVALTRDPSEAEDLTQEAFLRLFDHCISGHVVDNVVNWLLVVARNLMIDRTRGPKFEQAKCEGFWAHELRTHADLRANAEENAIAAHKQQEVQRVFSCLSEIEKNCLTLRSQGFQYCEIGQQLNVSIWSAAHYTSRAVRKLRQRIGETRSR
jgi:RNA polymerase sigma-70 factor (ECF subfamily)